ncbi:SH3 domain-containing protein [Tumidithrix helvetica PCC 7403]|uniref:hypothetical protein n=1 Tax=Tumidithrix helvetica TaxID=3457545 RepID=UPI003CB32920
MEDIERCSIRQILLATVLAIFVFLQGTATAIAAAGNQSNNQDLNQSATLVAPDKKIQIAIYAQPNAASQKRIGYGLSGDRVTLLQQVGSNTGKTWNLVRFENPPYAEGWVSQEFLSVQSANSPSQQDGQTGYFGSQKPQKDLAKQGFSSQKRDYSNNQNQNQ